MRYVRHSRRSVLKRAEVTGVALQFPRTRRWGDEPGAVGTRDQEIRIGQDPGARQVRREEIEPVSQTCSVSTRRAYGVLPRLGLGAVDRARPGQARVLNRIRTTGFGVDHRPLITAGRPNTWVHRFT